MKVMLRCLHTGNKISTQCNGASEDDINLQVILLVYCRLVQHAASGTVYAGRVRGERGGEGDQLVATSQDVTQGEDQGSSVWDR